MFAGENETTTKLLDDTEAMPDLIENCRKRKLVEVFECSVCNSTFNSAQQTKEHFESKKHKKTVLSLQCTDSKPPDVKKQATTKKLCELCNVTTNCEAQMHIHMEGSKHKLKVANQADQPVSNGVQTTSAKELTKNTNLYCGYCKVTVNCQAQMDAHREGSKHRSKVQKAGHGAKLSDSFVTENEEVSGTPSTQDKEHLAHANLYCGFCNISVNCQRQMDIHRAGAKHQHKLNVSGPHTAVNRTVIKNDPTIPQPGQVPVTLPDFQSYL